ncbi:hypothetical protein [Nocardia amamiensis]|uniref:hypothetical protein n=1 Tax=Nocardia amamiensis TaxID=404578 RepID=UPI0033DF591C
MAQVLAQALVTGREIEVGHADNSAMVTSVALPAGDIAVHQLQMDALEITQAVQDLGHSVPLIAGKRTVVRTYLSYYGSAPITVTGELSVRSSPSAPPVVIAAANSVTLNPADAGNLTVTRNDAARSLNFVLPSAAIAAGQRTIQLSNVTDVSSGAVITIGGERRPTVTFHRSPPLRVRILGISYQQGTPPVLHTPSNLDYSLLISWLGRVYPVSQVVSSQTVVTATATPPFVCGDINAQIAAIRVLDVDAGTDARTHYYGLVSDGGFFMRGCTAGIPGSPDPTVVASGPTGPAAWGWDFDGSYGDWYGGHELGHTFGRLHPGFCGETQDDLDNYPFPAGQLSTTDAGFAGFDVGDPINNLPLVALPGTQWTDVMTYCDRQWMSVYTYEAIRRRLQGEDALPAGTGGAAPGAGRPDERFGRRGVTAPRAGVAREESTVSVVANVNLTRGRGRIAFVNPVPNTSPTPPAFESPVVLRLAAADGRTLAEHPVAVKLNSELSPDDDRVGLVDGVVTVGPDVSAIELAIDGDVTDTFRADPTPPVVRAVRAKPVGDRLELAVDLEHPGREGHTLSVQVSSDQGRTWQTVGVGLRQPTAALDRNQFAASKSLLVRVIATNGFVSSVLTSQVL